MQNVALITLTGDRSECFALTEKYMARQTMNEFHWIVVDDGETPTPCTMGQQYIRQNPLPDRMMSFKRNLQVAIAHVDIRKTPIVMFIEDDDWYGRWYVEMQHANFRPKDRILVGEGWPVYYHIAKRRWRRSEYKDLACMSATAIRGDWMLRKVIESVHETGTKREGKKTQFPDSYLWKFSPDIQAKQKFLSAIPTQTLSIKGLPGRKGITSLHSLSDGKAWEYDDDLSLFTKYVGEDVGLYETYTEVGTEPEEFGYYPPDETDSPYRITK